MSLENEEPSFSGFLERKRFLGFYSHRFCSLSGNTLFVYKEQDKKKLDLKIEIKQSSRVEMVSSKPPRFHILNVNGDEFVFETENNELLLRWVLALRGCTFTNPDISMSMFKIISVIGRGFYGKVMLCENNENGEIVAIKSIHKSRLIQENKVHTVIAERNILAKAQHPFIVGLRFAFQTPSKFYLGLEYAPGGELFFHMQKRGCLPLNDVRIYVAEISLALTHLHRNGIIYRDLKPENVLLDKEGHVKLTDFGLSKDLAFIGANTATFCGTTEYLAPEVIRRENYDYAVDWWSLGVLTYEVLFGKTPFSSSNRARLFQNICEKDPVFPDCADKDVVQFISVLLTKDQRKRPGFDYIRNLPFFRNLDFNEVLQRKCQPEFIPEIENISKPNNFDPEFTNEEAADSFVMPVFGTNEKFAGFSYIDVNHLDEDSEASFARTFGTPSLGGSSLAPSTPVDVVEVV